MRLSVNKRRLKKVAILSMTVFLFVLAAGTVFYYSGFRINLTPSLPVGIWKINKQFGEIKKGDIIWFVPTKEVARFGMQRNYLVEKPGAVNNCIPLLKKVYGLPGDTYSFYEDFIRINNVPVENTKRRKADSKGRPMPKIENGIVHEGHLFVLTLNYHSFDSRYYGPIPIENVEGIATPILTWMN